MAALAVLMPAVYFVTAYIRGTEDPYADTVTGHAPEDGGGASSPVDGGGGSGGGEGGVPAVESLSGVRSTFAADSGLLLFDETFPPVDSGWLVATGAERPILSVATDGYLVAPGDQLVEPAAPFRSLERAVSVATTVSMVAPSDQPSAVGVTCRSRNVGADRGDDPLVMGLLLGSDGTFSLGAGGTQYASGSVANPGSTEHSLVLICDDLDEKRMHGVAYIDGVLVGNTPTFGRLRDRRWHAGVVAAGPALDAKFTRFQVRDPLQPALAVTPPPVTIDDGRVVSQSDLSDPVHGWKVEPDGAHGIVSELTPAGIVMRVKDRSGASARPGGSPPPERHVLHDPAGRGRPGGRGERLDGRWHRVQRDAQWHAVGVLADGVADRLVDALADRRVARCRVHLHTADGRGRSASGGACHRAPRVPARR